MSVSIFEKLLGSYSGMRKRTWSPSILEEGWDPTPEETKAVTDITATYTAAAQGQPQMNKGANMNVSMMAASKPGAVEISAPGVWTKTFADSAKFNDGFSMRKAQHSSSYTRKLVAVWVGGTKDENGETGDVQKSKKSKEDAAPEAGKAPAETVPKFSDDVKKSAKQAFSNLMGMADDAIDKVLLKIEKVINTPAGNTRLGKFFALVGVDNPTLEQKSKEQLTTLAGHLFSIADKHIVRCKNGRKYILKSDLSSDQVAALKVITVRNNGEVYFGRPEVSVPGYEELQQQASHGDSNYGFHLTASVNQLGPFLKNVRFVTIDDLPETMADKDFDALPQAFLSSKAGGSGGNDATGKLTEYFWELGFAIQTGDKEAVKRARVKVKKGLKALGALPQNLNSLESPITDQNMDILQDILDEVELAGGMPQFARNLVREVGLSVESFQTALNIQPKDVVLVDSPSQSSVMGDRPDVIAFIASGAAIKVSVLQVGTTPVKLHVVQPLGTFDEVTGKRLTGSDANDRIIAKYGESVIGTTMLNTSIKHKKREGGTTRMGSFAFQNMVEPTVSVAEYEQSVKNGDPLAPPSKYEVLHTAETDRLVAAKIMTPKQQQACKAALRRDRAHHAAVTRRIRALNTQNRKDVVNFLMSSSLTGSFSIEGRQKYEDEAHSIAAGLESEDPEVQRVAEIRIQQLARMRMQSGLKSGSALARASAMNDAIGSFAAELEEPIYIDSPQQLKVTTNRQVMDEVAKACWDPEGTVQVTPARTTVKGGDGSAMFGLRRVARKDKNPGYEFEMFPAAEEVATKPVPEVNQLSYFEH